MNDIGRIGCQFPLSEGGPSTAQALACQSSELSHCRRSRQGQASKEARPQAKRSIARSLSRHLGTQALLLNPSEILIFFNNVLTFGPFFTNLCCSEFWSYRPRTSEFNIALTKARSRGQGNMQRESTHSMPRKPGDDEYVPFTMRKHGSRP